MNFLIVRVQSNAFYFNNASSFTIFFFDIFIFYWIWEIFYEYFRGYLTNIASNAHIPIVNG